MSCGCRGLAKLKAVKAGEPETAELGGPEKVTSDPCWMLQ